MKYLALLIVAYVAVGGTIVAVAYGTTGRLPGRWERAMEHVRRGGREAVACYTFGWSSRRAERKFQQRLAEAKLTCMICRRVCEDEHAAFACTSGHLAAATDMTREIDQLIRTVEGREDGPGEISGT